MIIEEFILTNSNPQKIILLPFLFDYTIHLTNEMIHNNSIVN